MSDEEMVKLILGIMLPPSILIQIVHDVKDLSGFLYGQGVGNYLGPIPEFTEDYQYGLAVVLPIYFYYNKWEEIDLNNIADVLGIKGFKIWNRPDSFAPWELTDKVYNIT